MNNHRKEQIGMGYEIRFFLLGIIMILGVVIFTFAGYFDVAYLMIGIGTISMVSLVIINYSIKRK